jgi:phosphoenolpyruvate carboxykinase (ATP)
MHGAGSFDPAKADSAPFGLEYKGKFFHNLAAPRLYEEAIMRGEASIAKGGALAVQTGAHTGRSPHDKFIVRDVLTDSSIWWENNNAISPEHFDQLRADMVSHAKTVDLFSQDLHAGAEPAHRLRLRVYTEYAWHSLFIRNLLVRPSREETTTDFRPELTVLALPSFRADPKRHGCRSSTVIAVDFSRKVVLIGGTGYAGEIKKAVFGYLNFLLPQRGVLPMHCSANAGEGDTALFFGLSGTGKTTLSADPLRSLIGDDEHGWGPQGVFNFEGGCYAKAIKLSREAEPEIFATSERFGTILENVAIEPVTRMPMFDDDTRTENTRIAYPLDFISNASATGRGNHPTNIIMLTCDAFGVLPPISKLNPAQAMYHFLSGYTAKVAGTETGIDEPQATFSTCFGAPFMPRHPSEYGNLLGDRIAQHRVDCWLINTGWTGGGYGVGRRMPIGVTRALLRAALDGSLANVRFRIDPYFGVSAPLAVPGVEAEILDPSKTWASRQEFIATAERLVQMFRENFVKFQPFVDDVILRAQPSLLAAA